MSKTTTKDVTQRVKKLVWSDSTVRVKNFRETLHSERAKRDREAVAALREAGAFEAEPA